tara:strand:- start:3625 stop:4059 length:435 start_codon:yes stop_codon:yes gene_type:complete
MDLNSKKILTENNISITNPRLIVLETLIKLKKPIAIDDLFSLIENKVAKSTFYRVLNDLKEISILKEFNSPDNSNIVELFLDNTEHHHHLFCTLCGKVVDIELSINLEKVIESETKRLEKLSEFVIEDHGLELLGRCYECLNGS